MNREIEFRGKHNDEWVYGWLVEDKTNAFYITKHTGIGTWYRVEKETIGQYTGLKDRNGKKIFEGDIVENTLVLENNTFVTNIDVVEFNQEDCSFMLGKDKRHFNKNLDLEVIGNVYEDNLESQV